MAEDALNFNIFTGGQVPFLKALPGFAAVRELALPVTASRSGAASFYSIKQLAEGGKNSLQVFTDDSLVEAPFIKRPLKDAALLLFHAPAHDSFSFNRGAAAGPVAPLTASRRDISLLAGFAAADRETRDPGRLAAGEFALGRLHAAHYLYTLAAAANPASGARFSLASVLIELGLLQEAYDGLKTDRDPEALLNLAVIYRKTGSPDRAREYLAAIGQGTPLEDRKAAEIAWLDLEAGKEDEARNAFRRLSASAFDKAEALSGLGEALARTAFRTADRALAAEAEKALRSALVSPSSASGRIFLQLGNLYFRAGDFAQAEDAYRKAAAFAPSLTALANLAMSLLKTGKFPEAAAVTLQLALTDTPSAARLAPGFPAEKLAALFPEAPQPAPAAPAVPERYPTPAPFAPPRPQPAAAAQPRNEASLAPAQPQTPPPTTSGRRKADPEPAPAKAEAVHIETFKEMMAAPELPSEEESRRDDFISRAFRLASLLEDELGRKVYFNLDGLAEVEKKLRMAFIKNKENPQSNLETVKDCSAFLCYFLQERHKGRLIKMVDYDPWGWPMVFETAGTRTVSYPVQRVWRLLWDPTLPEPGWLSKYSSWLAGSLKEPAASSAGAAATRAKVMSHPERLTDAQTEHKRLLILISSLPETAPIEIGRTGLFKLETALKNNFRPDIPPATDGWKLLRCYGHILAEILLKDFKASWYNADGNDGGWSMRLPWKTFVFPIGKIYKTAADRGSLTDYYDTLLADKLRSSGPSAG